MKYKTIMGFLWGGDDLAIDKEMISQIKNSVNIVDVIGKSLSFLVLVDTTSAYVPFIKKKRPLLMSLKTDNFSIVLVVENQGMFLNLSRTIVKFLF